VNKEMILTDTHTHLYLNNFDADCDEMLNRAFKAGVKYMLLPNINSESAPKLLELCDRYPQNLFPMMGLHPTDVKENVETELENVVRLLKSTKFYAIGEAGIDLYWDKTFVAEQKDALRFQIQLAKDFGLPIVLHVRESFDEIFEILDDTANDSLTGVFHCFTGTSEQAEKAIGLGFKLGMGGVLTYKNSGLDKVVADIDMKHLVLETDSPYLTPMPFRGKRNESSYLRFVAAKLAEIKGIKLETVAEITTQNAIDLFNFPQS
jgi:TatD DNase family protein